MKNNKNKKQIIAKLAGVTLLSTTVLGTVTPLTGIIPGAGVVSSAQEVSNVEFTGKIKPEGVADNWGHRDTWVLNAKVKQRVKEGDKIQLKSKGLSIVELNNQNIKLKDGTIIGKVIVKDNDYYEFNGKKYYYFGKNIEGWNDENSALYTKDLSKLNDGQKNIKPDTELVSDFEIIFNKNAEAFDTLEFSIGMDNKRSLVITSNKDRTINYGIEFNGKKIIQNSINMKGVGIGEQANFSIGPISSLSEINNTESGLGSSSIVYYADPSTSEPLNKGDKIILESKSDSNFKFDSEIKWLTTGSILNLDHGRLATKGDSIINDHGVFVEKSNPLKVKILESTPDKMVFEVINDTYTETVNLVIPVKITSFDGYNKEENKISGLKAYMTTETKNNKTSKSISAPLEVQVKGVSVGASGIKIQYKTTQWVDEATKKSIKNSKIGETVEPAGTIDGYTFVRTDPDSKTGSVTHVFKKNQVKKVEDDVKVTTKWIDEATKESLTKIVIGDKPVEPGTIKGYSFLRTEHPTESEYIHVFKKNEEPKKVVTRFVDEGGHVIKEKPGTVEKEEIPDYTYVRTEKDKDGNTIHHYKSIITIFKDENGNVIKIDKGKKSADKITGYTFVKTELDKDGNTVHIYHKIVTKFINIKDGKEIILKTVDGDQPKEEIKGYTFVETKKDPKTGDVNHFYKDNDPAPIETLTIFKDENGNVIKTEKGQKDPDKIPGYTFIKTEIDKDGNTVHIYHKIVTKFVTEKDGKDFVLKTKDGEQPKEDIDGYDYEKTEKDEKTGDVIHLYKAKAKVSDKKEAVKTGASAGKFILPVVGLAGLGGLLSFVAKRKAKKKN